MENSSSEDEADKALRPTENVFTEKYIKDEVGAYLHDKDAKSKIPNDWLSPEKFFRKRHKPFRERRSQIDQENALFSVRLRDIEEPSVLLSVIDKIERTLQDDVKFYDDTIGNAVQRLQALRGRPSGLIQDVNRAACQASLPVELRLLLRTSLGHSLQKFISQINVIIERVQEKHHHHRIKLGTLVNLTKKHLTSLATYAQTRIQRGGGLFTLRAAILRHLGPHKTDIDGYLTDNDDFARNLTQAYDGLVDNYNEIQEMRKVLQRNFIGRVSYYRNPQIITSIHSAMDVIISNDVIEPEADILAALYRLYKLCKILNDI